MVKKAAIIQSNYIPWKGYFDIIHDVDVFVFLDDVQMTKRDWRTRNRIKTQRGLQWLTVPVAGSVRDKLICEVEIVQNKWQQQHLKSLQANYGKAPYFKEYGFLLDWLYGTEHSSLSEFNQKTTRMICDILGIETAFYSSTDFEVSGSKNELIINLCERLGSDAYLTGPAARSYIDEGKFLEAGITLEYKEYSDYPEYQQRFPPFEHGVSILDLLFNCGPASPNYIWQRREEEPVA